MGQAKQWHVWDLDTTFSLKILMGFIPYIYNFLLGSFLTNVKLTHIWIFQHLWMLSASSALFLEKQNYTTSDPIYKK